MKRIIILVCFLILNVILITSCDEEEFESMMEDLVKAAAIYKKAEMSGKLLCPKEKPYRMGGIIGGVCVDDEVFSKYVEIKLRGSTPYNEKEFILMMKAQYLGGKKGCPQDKPYYAKGFLIFGGECMSWEEFKKHRELKIEEWEGHEEIKGQTRFVDSPEFCDPGFLYDTHQEVCVSTSQCDAPHMSFDRITGACICEKGYDYIDYECVLEPKNKQCEYDSDCGEPRCSGNNKIMPRCDVRTWKCWTETVDCEDVFGADYTCVSPQVFCEKK